MSFTWALTTPALLPLTVHPLRLALLLIQMFNAPPFCGTSTSCNSPPCTTPKPRALHLACLALGVTTGDIVWTTPISFVASSNCALYCGATIDFVDIDSKSYNITVDALTVKLEKAAMNGTLPKVIIPVHLAGQPCEMSRIHALGQRYGFKIIEDASHAIGGTSRNQPIGNCG